MTNEQLYDKLSQQIKESCNEQLYILLKFYYDKLLQINESCGNSACTEDGQIFVNKIDKLAAEIYSDMKRLDTLEIT